MARPIFPYELGDEDFSWLISNFFEAHPQYTAIEDTCLPVVFIALDEGEFVADDIPTFLETTPAEGPLPEDTEV